MPRLIDDGTHEASGWAWIVGMHGAGVSLVEQLLSSHPYCFVGSRGMMLGYLELLKQSRIKIDPFWEVNNLQIVETYLSRELFAERLGSPVEELPLGWPATLAREWFEVLRLWMRTSAKNVPSLVVESSCRYRSMLVDVQAVFPGSHVVWVLRDPWDVVASTYRHKQELRMFAPGSSAVDNLWNELGILAQQARYYVESQCYGSLVKTVRYQDLRDEPELTAKRLADELRLPAPPEGWEPVLGPRPRQDEPIDARAGEHRALLAQIRKAMLSGDRHGLPWFTEEDVTGFLNELERFSL